MTNGQTSVCHDSDPIMVPFSQSDIRNPKQGHGVFKSQLFNRKLTTSKLSDHVRSYRESAFLYALTSAAVAQSIARACAQGRLLSCGCDRLGYRTIRRSTEPWAWGGCSHNLNYGIEYTRRFLDTRESSGDLQSRVNLHNNAAGISVSKLGEQALRGPFVCSESAVGVARVMNRPLGGLA
ncbi:Protein Wnt-7b [Eumeta japonica]|uniref:Protein Wnt n=1 Tax=Eumeta variegata TaxID=151549 RepID=A0A4C1V6K3_EUMVA|nr:Protein Wnt-7b [Eumeta japonica]